jgi:hypothetical protein
MPVRKNVLFDPKTNEYLYDILYNSPKHVRAELNPAELSIVRSHTNIKRFVNNEILERKLALFTKMGMSWALLFFDPSLFDLKQLEEVYRQYAIGGAPLENQARMIRENTFVMTDKTVALGMAMMASNCHQETYSINKNFLKVRDSIKHVKSISENADRNQNVEYLKAEKAMHQLSKVLHHSLQLDNYLETVLGLQRTDLHLLIFLFQKPHNFFQIGYIQRRLAHAFRPTTIATRARILFEKGYIEKLPTATKKPAYQIKAKGVLTLGEILNRIVNDAETDL